MPCNRLRYCSENIKLPPRQACKKSLIQIMLPHEQTTFIQFIRTSTCNQMFSLRQISAISCNGSIAPSTVVPAVAFTKNGICPLFFICVITSFRLSAFMQPYLSDFTCDEKNYSKIYSRIISIVTKSTLNLIKELFLISKIYIFYI